MKKYEIMILLKANLSLQEEKKLILEIEEKLGNSNIVKKEEIGLKQLAYPIKKQKEGKYILYYINFDEKKIKDLKKYFELENSILRTLVLKHDKKFPYEMKTTKDLIFPKSKRMNKFNSTTNMPIINSEANNSKSFSSVDTQTKE